MASNLQSSFWCRHDVIMATFTFSSHDDFPTSGDQLSCHDTSILAYSDATPAATHGTFDDDPWPHVLLNEPGHQEYHCCFVEFLKDVSINGASLMFFLDGKQQNELDDFGVPNF